MKTPTKSVLEKHTKDELIAFAIALNADAESAADMTKSELADYLVDQNFSYPDEGNQGGTKVVEKKTPKKIYTVIVRESENQGESKYVDIGVNGNVTRIKRGEQVEVNQDVYDGLRQTMTKYKQQGSGKDVKMVAVEVSRFPVEVVSVDIVE